MFRCNRTGLLAAALLTSLVAAAGCHAVTDDSDSTEGAATGTTAAETVWATKDWADRGTWYRTDQGSHLIDYGAFMALERDDATTPLATRESLLRFGFVYPPDAGVGTLTADARLPLGVLKDHDDDQKRDFVGLSCAACHTGEINAKGKHILVDGGQTFLQFEPFLASVQRSLDATTKDPAKHARFCASLGDAAGCDARLSESKARLDGLRARNHQTVLDGPGRIDAVSRILNEAFSPKSAGGQFGGEPSGNVEVPVSIPHVWDAPRLSCVQTNCLSTNSYTRNSGEVIGVFGHASLTRNGDALAVTGSPKTANLYALEKALESLQSPKWESSLGTLDGAKKQHGESLFAQNCASCHTEPYKSGPNSTITETENGQTHSLWKVTTMPYQKVGTDPRFIEVHGSRMVDDPDLHDLFDQALRLKVAEVWAHDHGSPPDSLGLDALVIAAKGKQIIDGQRTIGGKISSLLALGAVTGTLERGSVAAMTSDPNAAAALKDKLEFSRAPAASIDLAVYRARPLNGIAFTAPFGHNGTWPTLWEMLKPPAQRTKKFVVRPSSFDTNDVGLDISPAADGDNLFTIDTTTLANSNLGHDFGTKLSDDDKRALLEYLKSL